MGFLDKLKDVKNTAMEAVGSAAQSAKDSYEKVIAEIEQKKADADALDAALKEKERAFAKEIIEGIKEYTDGSKGGVFSSVDEERVLKFTKEFYEKILLPGNRNSSGMISMYPYIDDKKVRAFGKTFSDYNTNERPLIYIKDDDGQEILFTYSNFYFKFSLPENKKYFGVGAIPCKEIDLFAFYGLNDEQTYEVKCDQYKITEIYLKRAHEQDFISLNEYFRCFRMDDYTITDEEVDKLIQQKIGQKSYDDIKKYMVDENERILYYAGGLDSLTSKDYIACTTKQVIIISVSNELGGLVGTQLMNAAKSKYPAVCSVAGMIPIPRQFGAEALVDKEMIGAAVSVKQLYYEDIKSMTAVQDSNNKDLLSTVVESALTAAFKLCDLVITVDDLTHNISTLNTIEAGRVIAIYQEKKKEIKSKTSAPQAVIQQESHGDILSQLEKLAQLKDAGILTEEEFTAKKTELLLKI